MTNDLPLISVIVPVYDVEPYLEKCVRSIQNQTYTNLEIILVDDGSPDHCGEMCDEFAADDKRIKVVHRENGGLSAARNSGLDIATGEYVGFVDSDDYVDEDMYACLYGAIVKYHVNLAVCRAKIVSVDSDYTPTNVDCSGNTTVFIKNEAQRHILTNMDNSVCNKLFYRALIGTLRFPHGRIHGEDFMFIVRYLSQVNGAVVLNSEKYNYVKRDNSITSSSFSQSSLDEIYTKDAIRTYIVKYYPDYEYLAEKWCFKARMNVVRAIMIAEDKKAWKNELNSCSEYIKKNYTKVRNSLSKKERLEYFLQRYFRAFYPFAIKIALKSK